MSITEDTEELVRGAKEGLLGNRDSHQRKIRTGEMVQPLKTKLTTKDIRINVGGEIRET